jgi:hypothetical protein
MSSIIMLLIHKALSNNIPDNLYFFVYVFHYRYEKSYG